MDLRQDGAGLARRLLAAYARFLEDFERQPALLAPEGENEAPVATPRATEPEAVRPEPTSARVDWLGDRRQRRG